MKRKRSSVCTRQSECFSNQPINEVPLRENKTSISDEIVKDLTEPNMIIFGVYGSSISRKANVVAQIKKRVERDGLFDAVLTASQITNPNLQGIQWVLGDQLGLQLNEITTQKERASCLCDKIKTKEKILIILVLDDLLGGIDLAEIGIPFGNDHLGSKILLTAEIRELLSDKMKTQKEYSVHDEAEELDLDSYECVPPFGEPYCLHKLLALPHNGKVVSESMKTKLDEIEMAVKQPNMRIVGVYGSSYARKHVVEQITRRLERDGVFDVVVHVMASMNKKNRWPRRRQSELRDLRRIQEQLAKKLGVHIDKTSVEERVTRLCYTIKSKGNILIILDDLEGGIDLDEVGIPFGNDHLASKIMLLAQTQEVLSNQINAPQREFSVDD